MCSTDASPQRSSPSIPHAAVRQAVLGSTAVEEAVGYTSRRAVVDGKLTTVRKINRKRMALANEIYDNMAARPRMGFVRILAVILRKAFRLLYALGVHITEDEVERVREAQRSSPVLLLPTHKSHVDYLVMQMMCFSRDLHMPVVVAGDNLNIPFVRSCDHHCCDVFLL